MTAAFFLGQNVNLGIEVSVGVDGTGLCQNLTTLNLGPLDTAEKSTDVVACDRLIEELTEHLNAGNNGLLGFAETDDLNGIVYLYNTALNTTGCNGAAAGDGEYVLNGHKEGLVGSALGLGNVLVNSIHKLENALALGGFLCDLACGECFESAESGTPDDGDLVAGEVVAGEQLTDFHFNKLKELFVVNLVNLVHENNDVGNTDLTSEQDVLTGLGHGAVRCGNNEDRAVHLCCAGDHVLNIVSVAGAVNVCIVTVIGLVFNVSGVDGYTTGFLFGSLVDFIVTHCCSLALLRESHGDCSGEGGLAMVNVTDGADVYMGFGSFELLLCHCEFLLMDLIVYSLK